VSALADRDYFTDREVLKTPYASFDAVRERSPVYVVPETGVVVVVGHEEALQVLGDSDRFSAAITAAGAGAPLPFTPEGDDLTAQIEAHRTEFRAGEEVITLDDKQHSFSRGLINGFFVPSRLKTNELFMVEASKKLVRAALDNDGAVEMVHEVNIPFTTVVIANLLNVPEKDYDLICEIFKQNPVNNLEGRETVEVHALIALSKYFANYVEERKNAPGGDITSALAVSTYPDGSKPDTTEIVRLATMLFAAGQDTTAKLLGNAMRYLIEQPALQDRLRADPSLMPGFIEEMLRIEGSTKVTARLARKPARIGDLDVPAGTRVLVSLAGANRDPRRWADPNTVELGRPRIKEHLAFSRGAHACIGAQLARTESRILIETFLQMTSKIDYDERFHPNRTVEYEPNFILRGISALHLKLTPA
jgi:cytochrome P450